MKFVKITLVKFYFENHRPFTAARRVNTADVLMEEFRTPNDTQLCHSLATTW